LRRGGRGAVAKATVNIFCFLKKLSNTLPWKVHRNQWVRNLRTFILILLCSSSSYFSFKKNMLYINFYVLMEDKGAKLEFVNF
ncbi:MAG: hypothetical protein KKH45_09260, partial [Proteobacteria bacterium]|nr:hypothetical protein [Pseudomonadota bacterium]